MRLSLSLMAVALLYLSSSTISVGGLIGNENSTWPSSPAFQTFTPTAASIVAERDIRFNRNLLQTFQIASAFQIDKIFLDYEEGVSGKEISLRIFTVPDVNALTILDPDNGSYVGSVLLSGVSFTTTSSIVTVNGNNDPTAVLEFDLTGIHEISLPATSGTAGYAFQILRTGSGSDIDDTAQRAFKWHSGTSQYAGGRGFQVNGTGGPGATVDYTLAITAVPEPSTFALGLIGVAGCVLLRQRKNRHSR